MQRPEPCVARAGRTRAREQHAQAPLGGARARCTCARATLARRARARLLRWGLACLANAHPPSAPNARTNTASRAPPAPAHAVHRLCTRSWLSGTRGAPPCGRPHRVRRMERVPPRQGNAARGQAEIHADAAGRGRGKARRRRRGCSPDSLESAVERASCRAFPLPWSVDCPRSLDGCLGAGVPFVLDLAHEHRKKAAVVKLLYLQGCPKNSAGLPNFRRRRLAAAVAGRAQTVRREHRSSPSADIAPARGDTKIARGVRARQGVRMHA